MNGLKIEDVLEILGRDEIANRALKLLLNYSTQGYIPPNEVDDLDLVLLLEGKRLALPVDSDKLSLSWNMRYVQTKEKMEIPYIIRLFFKELAMGEVNVFRVIEEYFKRIGEYNPKDFVEIFREIVKERDKFLICGDSIVRICSKYNRDGGVVIAEMKGAGIISPYVGCGKLGKANAPIYEINRFLLEILEIATEK